MSVVNDHLSVTEAFVLEDSRNGKDKATSQRAGWPRGLLQQSAKRAALRGGLPRCVDFLLPFSFFLAIPTTTLRSETVPRATTMGMSAKGAGIQTRKLWARKLRVYGNTSNSS